MPAPTATVKILELLAHLEQCRTDAMKEHGQGASTSS